MTAAGFEHVVPLLRGRARLLLGYFLTAIGRSLCSILVLLLIQRFLSGALAPGGAQSGMAGAVLERVGERGALWVVAVLLVAVQLTGSVLSYGNVVLQQYVSAVVELGVMEKLIRHLLTLSIPFFDRQSHGDVLQTIRDDVLRLRLMVRAAAGIGLESALALGLLYAALRISPWLSLLALVVVPVASAPIYLIAKKALRSSVEVRKSGYVLSDIALQILRGIRVIKVFQAEEMEARASVEKGNIFYDNVIRQVRAERLGVVVMEALSGLLLVVVIVAGGHQVYERQMDWSRLLTFVMAVRALYGPLNNINTNFMEIQTTRVSVLRIAEFLATRPEIRDAEAPIRLRAAPGVIAFDHVSFSFGDRPILRDVSFTVTAGTTIGVVGPSGSGKSTLLALLVRFYDATSGAVRIDGHDLRELALSDVYSKVALVTQEPFLFSATVRDNIRCARPSASDREVEEAARAAYIHEQILALPQGYDTPVGMGGRELSGGQRQRISVARALLKNAPLLLLDEATSALDSVAEAEVQRAIDALMVGRTSFVVAHRLSTLRDADRLIVLDEGRLVGFAPHEELLATCGVYQRLWEAQRFGAKAEHGVVRAARVGTRT